MDFLPDLNSIPVLAFAYAEIHYHFRFLYPLYYRRQPEIIADLPRSIDLAGFSYLPLLIFIKDAYLFPVHLNKVIATLSDNSGHSNQETFDLDLPVNTSWFSYMLPLDISQFEPETEIFTTIKLKLTCRNKKITVINDNFRGLAKKPFRTWLAAKALNLPSGWFAGDPHYHSNFTSDQVEFGAEISFTRTMALAQGLSWFCVTDHSYDLDDRLDDYTKNDSGLPIWKRMLQECLEYDKQGIRIISGEEISIGNRKGQNVHLLALNHPEFIEGHGDSAEIWGKNKPQHSLTEIPHLKNDNNLFIAAHPMEKVTTAQRLTLRRGNWSLDDYHDSGVNLLQLINSDEPEIIEKNIRTWTNYLLQGEKFFIIAGNDAHGNFNIMRQIKFPFLKLWSTPKQTFGNWLTIFEATENDPLPALKAGRMIVSNGPFLSFYINQLEDKWQLGETCPLRHGTVEYDARTTPRFGEIDTIYCYRGDLETGKEFRFPVACPVNIALPAKGYIRMSLITIKGFTAYTNPIFTSH